MEGMDYKDESSRKYRVEDNNSKYLTRELLKLIITRNDR